MGEKKAECRHARSLRLLVFLVFPNFFLSAQTDGGFAEMSFTSSSIHLNSVCKLTLKLDKNSERFTDFSKSPEIIVKTGAEVLELLESSTYHVSGSMIIQNKYKAVKIGKSVCTFVLQSGEAFLNLPPVNLEIIYPPLSKNTEFKWAIAENSSESRFRYLEIQEDTIIQGCRYMLFLKGTFSTETVGNKNKLSVEHILPDNAAVERVENTEKFFLKQDDRGLTIAAVLYWTPVLAGEQKLPDAVISFLNRGGAKVQKRFTGNKVFVHKAVFQSENLGKIEKELEKAFGSAVLVKPKQEESEILYCKSIMYAKKIAELRKAEAFKLFPHKASIKRHSLEKELGIEESFPVYSILYIKLGVILSFFITAAAVLFYFVKFIQRNSGTKSLTGSTKKIHIGCYILTVFFTASSFCFLLFLGYAAAAFRKTAVFIPTSRQAEYRLRIVPEKTSSAADSVAIGETVKVLKTTKHWAYIKKLDGSKGWLLKKDLR